MHDTLAEYIHSESSPVYTYLVLVFYFNLLYHEGKVRLDIHYVYTMNDPSTKLYVLLLTI